MDRETRIDRCSLLAKMVAWLDGYASLYPTDVAVIERKLKGWSGTDVDAAWKQVKDDVYAISQMPTKSAEVQKAFKRLSMVRYLLLAAAASSIVLMFVFTEGYLAFAEGEQYVLLAPIMVSYGTFSFYTFTRRSVNKKVTEFYDGRRGELSDRRRRIRRVTQTLIDKLYADVRSMHLEPDKFRFELFGTDYKNVTLVRRKGPKNVATVASAG